MRYVLEVMYDGTKFHGSQVQGDTPTVQLEVNKAISTILRQTIISVGASRTDEGVHALCNYYHFDLERELDQSFLYKCNSIMPHGLAVKRVCKAANPEFNARFDALTRRYRYRIYFTKNPFLHTKALYYPFRFNHEVLQETAAVIKEHQNFESFAKRNAQVHTFNCNIIQSHWEYKDDELHYIVEANRFLRGMVRGLVGTQLHMARYNGSAQDLTNIIEAHDCRKAFFDVTGHGLYLEHISYKEGELMLVS